jgi:hypothetical protein
MQFSHPGRADAAAFVPSNDRHHPLQRWNFSSDRDLGIWAEGLPRRLLGDGMMNDIKTSIAVIALAAVLAGNATARDDGRYTGSPLKPWFDTLKSAKGLCCSVADGFVVADPDWESKDGHYRVRLDGEWIMVPDDAVVTEPNRAGRTMVWPIKGPSGISIRCFLPGSMT